MYNNNNLINENKTKVVQKIARDYIIYVNTAIY